MPLLKLQTSMPLADDQQAGLAKELSKLVAQTIGKPEGYVMVALSSGAICMGGELGPAAFVDLRSIGGLGGDVNKQLSAKISTALAGALDIPSARIFLNFTEVPAPSWGHNGGTFG